MASLVSSIEPPLAWMDAIARMRAAIDRSMNDFSANDLRAELQKALVEQVDDANFPREQRNTFGDYNTNTGLRLADTDVLLPSAND